MQVVVDVFMGGIGMDCPLIVIVPDPVASEVQLPCGIVYVSCAIAGAARLIAKTAPKAMDLNLNWFIIFPHRYWLSSTIADFQ